MIVPILTVCYTCIGVQGDCTEPSLVTLTLVCAIGDRHRPGPCASIYITGVMAVIKLRLNPPWLPQLNVEVGEYIGWVPYHTPQQSDKGWEFW